MAYSLVKFWEGVGKLESSVLPSNWISDGKVYWCNDINAKRSLDNKVPLNKEWPSYKLYKVVFKDGRYRQCCVQNKLSIQSRVFLVNPIYPS